MLVCTDVAARGIHVDNISLVLHVDPPQDHKSYLHRGGRTARAGEKGTVVTLVLPNERRSTDALTRRAGIHPFRLKAAPGHPRLAEVAGARTPERRGRSPSGSPTSASRCAAPVARVAATAVSDRRNRRPRREFDGGERRPRRHDGGERPFAGARRLTTGALDVTTTATVRLGPRLVRTVASAGTTVAPGAASAPTTVAVPVRRTAAVPVRVATGPTTAAARPVTVAGRSRPTTASAPTTGRVTVTAPADPSGRPWRQGRLPLRRPPRLGWPPLRALIRCVDLRRRPPYPLRGAAGGAVSSCRHGPRQDRHMSLPGLARRTRGIATCPRRLGLTRTSADRRERS